MALTTSTTGLNLIKSFEGCRLTAYQDSVGVWTIGYGHTSGVKEGQTITQAQADAYLKTDLASAEKNVNSFNDKYGWNQNQFDALVSFAFNIGSINQLTANGTRTIAEISAKIPAYNKAGGTVLQGLVNRRAAEKKLFDTAVSTTSSAASSSDASTSSSKLKVTSTIKAVQTWLNTYYKTGLSVDGKYGSKTKAALIKAWQTEVGGLTVDGVFGTKSKTKAASTIIKSGSSGIIVTIWQAYLVCRGYSPNGIDGSFGSGCKAATIKFQKANSLTQDGAVGQKTWAAAFS